MKLTARKISFGVVITIFSLFNIYKALDVNFQELRNSYNLMIHNVKFVNNDFLQNRTKEELDPVPLDVQLHNLGRPINSSEIQTAKVVINGKTYSLPIWQHLLVKNSTHVLEERPFFLVAVLQVRLYSYDKAKWSINELKQWFHYLFLAGVEHILICDHFMFAYEKFEHLIKTYIQLGLVSYHPWGFIRNPMAAQIKCYQRFIKKYKRLHVWHVAIDIDEYPFSYDDCNENFLVRFLQKFHDDISEISMANYLMLGQGNRSGNLVIKRINRMTKNPANALSKPLYRPANVRSSAVHHNHLARGSHIEAPHNELSLLHYWGGRDQNWGPDTKKTIDITYIMNTMKLCWGQKLEDSLITFNEIFALSNSTGP